MLKVKGYIKQWLPVVVFLLITTACSEEGEHLPGDGSEARIPLKVSALLASPGSNTMLGETRVSSLFVFIYNEKEELENFGRTEVPSSSLVPAGNGYGYDINYEWELRPGEKEVFIVANPPSDQLDLLKRRLSIIELRTLIFGHVYYNFDIMRYEGGLMVGKAHVNLSSRDQLVPINLLRRYARLDLYIRKDLSQEDKVKVTYLGLKNYSWEVMLFESEKYQEQLGNPNGPKQDHYTDFEVTGSYSFVRYHYPLYMMSRTKQTSLDYGIPTLVIDIDLDNNQSRHYEIPLAYLDANKNPTQPWEIRGNYLYELRVTLTPDQEYVPVDISVLPWEETPQQEYINGELREHTNCYVVDPGGTVSIPTASVYKIWNWFLKDPIPAGSKVEAELIWSDTPGLISSVTVEKGYDMMSQAQIRVKTADPSLRGNAVIGMKVEGESDYRWSWHVWVTDTGVLTEAMEGGDDQVKLNVLSVILGSLSNENENKDFGLLYQWGRKDPFPNPVNGQPQLYGKTDTEHPVVQIQGVSEVNNIRNGIRNPLVFYTSTTSPYDWSTTMASEQDAQLWRDKDGFKSIYDPCPYGWRVASKEDLPDPISYTTWSDGVVRIFIQEFIGQVHYPCGGYQDGQSGALQGQNSELCYWTSSKGSPQAYGMYGKWGEYNVAGNAAIDYKPTNRANGYSVRCVRNN